MKNLYPLLILLFLSLSIYAQSPDKMSYQAVVRDANNTLVANQTVGMQISILQSTITGTVVYTETHSVDTNLNGLVSLEIGNGSSSDNFSEIDWSAGPYFIKTETDPTGGSSYTITGTSQLMSVPFALYATTSGSSQTNATNITNNTTAIETNTTAIELNTAKVGITTEQSDAITANTAKVGYTEAAVSANTDVAANTAKVGYTDALVSANTDVAANTAKVGYTDALVSANTDVVANTAKVGITTEQADAIAANTVKTNPWSVNSTNDSISYEKKVVIGSLASVNTPGLTVYGTTSGPSSPTANFVRSQTRNNVLQFETSEEDNGYRGSVGIIGNGGNTNLSNLFNIGINDGESWYNPLRIYYDNKAFRLGFGSDGISDINNFGTSSISLGTNSFATGDYSSTLGTDNTASGLNSTALGINSQATAVGAIVLGTNSIASGDNSTAMGLNVKASGSGSTAIGLNSTATGNFSNTFGVDIEAYSFAETVVGRFNTIYEPAGGVSGYDYEDRLFVVGKGESDTNRSDALIIKKSGEMSLEGNQIKNLQDPTENQDAVTLAYLTQFQGETGITTAQANAIIANTAKVGITTAQANAIIANTSKTSMVLGTTASTALAGNTSTITSDQANAITANTAKVGITSDQSDAITANTVKTSMVLGTTASTALAGNTTTINSDQANAITANTAKITNATHTGDVTGVTALTIVDDAVTTDKIKDANVTDAKIVTVSASKLTGTVGVAKGGTNLTAYTQGDILYATSTTTLAKLPKGTAGQVLTMNTGATAPEWTSGSASLIAALEARIAALEESQPAEIGDLRAGGIVFWVDPSDNTHGLVCALQDQSSSIRWYNGSFEITGATGTALGTGSANTDAIILAQGATESSYAAGLARSYSGGGYNDWYLPSKDELNEIYNNKSTINTTALENGGSNFINFYVSSSEYSSEFYWEKDFSSGNEYEKIKSHLNGVRAVRAF